MKSWLSLLFSGNNDGVDVKAVSATFCLGVAVIIVILYVIKDVFVSHADIPPNIHNIIWVFVGAGLLGGAATLINNRMPGQVPPPLPHCLPHPADLPVEEGPAG